MLQQLILKCIAFTRTPIAASYFGLREVGELYESRMSTLLLAIDHDGHLCVVKRARLHTYDQDKRNKLDIRPDDNRRALENDAKVLKLLGEKRHLGIISHRVLMGPNGSYSNSIIALDDSVSGKPPFLATEFLGMGTLRDLLDQKNSVGKLYWTLIQICQRLNVGTDLAHFIRFSFVRSESLFVGRQQTFHPHQLSVEQALQIFRLVLDALQVIHSQGFVHRDISLKNIGVRKVLIQGKPIEPGDIVLFDFGLALQIGQPCGNEGARKWMEPARLIPLSQNIQLSAYTGMDIYSLALVLRCMLTGQDALVMPDMTSEYTTWEKWLYSPISANELKFETNVSSAMRTQVAKQINHILRRCFDLQYPLRRPSAHELCREVKQIEAIMTRNVSRATMGVLAMIRSAIALLSMFAVVIASIYLVQSCSPITETGTEKQLTEIKVVIPPIVPLRSKSTDPMNTFVITKSNSMVTPGHSGQVDTMPQKP